MLIWREWAKTAEEAEDQSWQGRGKQGLRKTMAFGIASSYHELVQNDFLVKRTPIRPSKRIKGGFFSFNGLLLLVCQIQNQGTRC